MSPSPHPKSQDLGTAGLEFLVTQLSRLVRLGLELTP